MGELFNVKQATLSEHINNIISSGELNETSIGFSDRSSGGRKAKRKSKFIKENIDEIIFMFALFKCRKSDKGRN